MAAKHQRPSEVLARNALLLSEELSQAAQRAPNHGHHYITPNHGHHDITPRQGHHDITPRRAAVGLGPRWRAR